MFGSDRIRAALERDVESDREYQRRCDAHIAGSPAACGNCKFNFSGWCRRYPMPFPPNHATAWCGEYVRKWPAELGRA